jgi:hypothetical protein
LDGEPYVYSRHALLSSLLSFTHRTWTDPDHGGNTPPPGELGFTRAEIVMAVMFAPPTFVQASVATPSWLASLAAGTDVSSESGEEEKAAVDGENDPDVLWVCAHVLDAGRPISKSTH